MSAVPASRLPASVVTRVVPLAVGSDWTPDRHQGLLWEEPIALHAPDAATALHVDHEVPADLEAWARRFCQAVVEAVAGHRPVAQLVRWTSRGVYRDLERRTQLAQRAATVTGGMPVQRSRLRPQVCSVHLCVPSPGIAEASVHVRHGRRSRAVAMRFEGVRGRWQCTAMEFA